MILSLPVGPRSAPGRVLVEMTGARIGPTEPTTYTLVLPDKAAWWPASNAHAYNRPDGTEGRYGSNGSDRGKLAEHQAFWDADLLRRQNEARSDHARATDNGYHHAFVTLGFGEQSEAVYTHATLYEITAAIRTAHASGDPIAEVQHAYPAQEPA